MKNVTFIESVAIFSPCKIYRYVLTRRWEEHGKVLNCIGLNPSTATESIEDPTIRRVIGFAKDWGYGALAMTNLCAIRATDPKVAWAHEDPVGPENWEYVVEVAGQSDMVLAAWGAHPLGTWASSWLVPRLPRDIDLYCLGTTKSGAPKHPLYIAKTTVPILYRAAQHGEE